jgi:hypothetical protein
MCGPKLEMCRNTVQKWWDRITVLRRQFDASTVLITRLPLCTTGVALQGLIVHQNNLQSRVYFLCPFPSQRWPYPWVRVLMSWSWNSTETTTEPTQGSRKQ